MSALLDLSLGRYELEEPWGRLVEVARSREGVPVEPAGEALRAGARRSAFETHVLRDRTTRTSLLACSSVGDAVRLARFLEAHVAEIRRWLLDRMGAGLGVSEHARLRSLEPDVHGADCRVRWSFTTGDADPAEATAANVEALHRGYLAELAPVPLEGAALEPRPPEGGKAVVAACRLEGPAPSAGVVEAAAAALVAGVPRDGLLAAVSARPGGAATLVTLRVEVPAPAGPGYRLVQVAAAAALAQLAGEAAAPS